MSEHDLGTAHGKIEIESDVNGVNKTLAQMAALKAAITSVSKPLEQLDDAMEQVSKRSSLIASSLSKVQAAAEGAGRGLQRTGRTVAELTGLTRVLDGAMGDLTGTLGTLIQRGQQFNTVLQWMRDPISKLGELLKGKLLFGLTGINREMNNFPKSIQKIAKVAAGITAVGVGATVARKGLAAAGLALYRFAGRSSTILSGMIGIELAFRNATGAGGRFETQMNMLRSMAEKADGSIFKFYRNLNMGAKGITQAITGAALLTSGFRQLGKTIGPVFKLLMSPKGLLGLGAIGAGLAALKPASSIVLGLVDGLKQLSGAALIVPGALAVLGVAGGVAAVAFKGLGDAFKAAFADGAKFDEATKNMSGPLKAIAVATREWKDELKTLQGNIQERVLNGMANQIEALGKNYMPVLIEGTKGVADGLNLAVKSLGDFANSGSTVTDFNRLLDLSAKSTRNLAQGLQPVLEILRDVGMEGAEAFTRLTTGVGATTTEWAAFIAKARETGELRRWIEDGIQGFQDLGSAIVDTSVAIGGIFQGLGGNGDDALARLADSAQRFRETVESPSSDSGLHNAMEGISDAAERMKLLLSTVFDAIAPSIQSASTLLAEFSDGFTGRFIQSFEMFGTVLHGVAAAIGELSIIGQIIGSVLGAAAALKVLLLILGPVTAALKIFVGAFMIGGGLSKLLFTAALAIETFAARMGVAGTASRVAAGGFLFLATTLTGPVLGALVAVGAALALFKMESDEHTRAQQKIQEDYKASGDAARQFSDEVMKANGAISGSALDAMTQSVGKLREAWEGQGEDDAKWTDVMGGILSGDVLKDISPSRDRNDQSTVSDMDENAAKARNMQSALESLKVTNEDLSVLLTSSDGTWEGFRQRLLGVEEGGADAAAELDRLRQQVEDTRAAADAVGPAALEVSNGLKTIADESSSASDKLSALMSVMRGLGLIESTAEEAAMSLAAKLSKVVEDAQSSVNQNATLGIELVDPNTGRLKESEENARALYTQLTGLRQEYYNVVAAGGDATAKFNEMLPTLLQLGEQYGFNEEQLRSLITQYGFVPDKIETIMSVAGSDKVKEDLVNVILELDRIEGKGKKTITIETQEAVTALQGLGVQITNFNPEMKTADVVIPPGLGDETKRKIQEILDAAGGIKPKIVPPAPGEIPPIPVTPEMVEADRQRVIAQQQALLTGGVMPITPEIVEADKQNVLEIQRQLLTTPVDAPVVPEIDVTNLEDFKNKVAEAEGSLQNLNGQSANAVVTLEGADAVVGALNGINDALVNSANMFAQYVSAVGQAMEGARQVIETMAAILTLPLNTAAVNAVVSGQSLGQGFADGIISKEATVRAAALRLAEAASAPLPRSPAKIGPFSGRGWTPFRGASLAEGFAEGITKATPLAENSALSMAVAVADAMDSIRAEFNMPGTSFSANTFAPGSKSYYRDPTVSDAELAEKREERRKQKEEADAKQARKDAQKAADSLPSAQEKVAKANERIIKAEEAVAKARIRVDEAKNDKTRQTAEENLRKAEERLNEAHTSKYEAEQKLADVQNTAGGATPDGVQGGLTPNKSRTDYIEAMSAIASTFGLEMTSGVREGDPGHHGSGRAADFSNGTGNTDQMLAFAEFMNANFKPYIKELIYDDPRFSGREIKEGKNVDSGFYDGAGDHTNHVHLAVNYAPEFSAGGQVPAPAPATAQQTTGNTTTKATIDPTRTDLSKEEVASIIIARGRAMGMSDTQIQSALATGLVERELQNLPGGPDSSTGVFQQQNSEEWTKGGTRNRMNVDDAATSYYEHLQGVDPSLSPGEQAQAVQRSAYPEKYAERMGEAQALMDAVGNNGPAGSTALAVHDSQLNETEADALTRMKASDEALANALSTATDPNASDADVVRALNTIDNSMSGLNETDKELLDTQKQAIMEDRGIKEYDPYEGKIEPGQEFDVALGAAQTLVGLFHTLENGMQNAAQTAQLLTRGVSNTKEVHSLIDGFQGMASTIGEVVSAVGSIVNVVAQVAATAGAAIPGIGQVGAVVAGITGGIANVNAVIDLVQDVMHIAGRFGGGILASIAGGSNGQLQGNVKTLLDMNDGTIKTWSDRNAAEKTVHGIPGISGNNNPNTAPTIGELNVNTGPGTDPRQAMDAAMFAVKAHSQGVFAG